MSPREGVDSLYERVTWIFWHILDPIFQRFYPLYVVFLYFLSAYGPIFKFLSNLGHNFLNFFALKCVQRKLDIAWTATEMRLLLF